MSTVAEVVVTLDTATVYVTPPEITLWLLAVLSEIVVPPIVSFSLAPSKVPLSGVTTNFIDAIGLLAGSLTVADGAIATAVPACPTPASMKLAELVMPAPAPFRSTTGSFTAVTATCTCTAPVVDSAPLLSLATTVNAFSVPLASGAPVQYAWCVASTVSLVPAAHAVALPALVPISSVPLLTAVTTNAVTVPSTSASLPCATMSANVIVACASSLTVATVEAIAVSVGASFTAVMFTVSLAMVANVVPPEVFNTIEDIKMELGGVSSIVS